MKYRGGKLATATERILVHLSGYRSYKDEMEVPIEITQTGIAEAVGIAIANLRRAIHPLIEKGWVETHKAHVPGIRVKRNGYYLTSLGRVNALALKNEILNYNIEIIDLEGKVTSTPLGEASRSIPFDVNISDILRETENGIFNCQLFLRKKRRVERQYFGQLNILSKPRHFVNRSDELEKIQQWLDSSFAPTLVIKGMPGIGKTTLIAKVFEESPPYIQFWSININPWTSLRSVLRLLSKLSDENDKGEILNYLNTNANIELKEIEHVLLSTFSGKTIALIFDDFHNANSDILNFLSILHNNISRTLGDFKLIVSGRFVEPFYEQTGEGEENIFELPLEGLDFESTIALAKAKGFSQKNIDNIYSQTQGHPLFVELLTFSSTDELIGIEDFINQYIQNLNKEDFETLKYLSVFRYPIKNESLPSYQQTLKNLLKFSIIIKSEDGFIEVHKIIKDALYARLSDKETRLFHMKASEYYLKLSGTTSIIEALHHLLYSSQIETIMKILIDKEEDILRSGKMKELSRILTILLSTNIDTKLITDTEKLVSLEEDKQKVQIDKTLDNVNKIQRISYEIVYLRHSIGEHSKIIGQKVFNDNSETSRIAADLQYPKSVRSQADFHIFIDNLHKYLIQSAKWGKLSKRDLVKACLDIINRYRQNFNHIYDMKNGGKGTEKAYKELGKINTRLLGHKIIKNEEYPLLQLKILETVEYMLRTVEEHIEEWLCN